MMHTMKSFITIGMAALALQGCAATERAPAAPAAPLYCNDPDVLRADFAPESYAAVESAVQATLLHNGFSPDEGRGRFVADARWGHAVVGWLFVDFNRGVEISPSGSGYDGVPAPPSLRFRTQSLCDANIDYKDREELFKKLATEVVERLDAEKRQAVPGAANKKSIEHHTTIEIYDVRAE
jgi:hypothetical protein